MVVFSPDCDGEDEGTPWSTDLWAPEIHNIKERSYIIFSTTLDRANPQSLPNDMSPYCLPMDQPQDIRSGPNGRDARGNDTMKGELKTFDQFAIDGTANDSLEYSVSLPDRARVEDRIEL